MKYRPLILILIEHLVKIPIIRKFLHHAQVVLYTYPLFTGFILLLGYIFCMLVPLRTGKYVVGISGYPLKEENLSQAVCTQIYVRLLICTIFLSIPPLTSLLLDCWKSFSNPLHRHEFFSYLLIIFSYFLPNLSLYIQFHDRDPASISREGLYFWVAATRIQQVAVTLGMLSAVFGHRAKYQSSDSLSFLKFSVEKRTVNIMISYFLSAFFALVNGDETESFTLFRILSVAGMAIGVLLSFATVIRIMTMLIRQAFQEKQFRTHYHVSDFMYTSSFTIFIFVGGFFTLLASKTGGTEAALLQYMMSITATEIFLLCIVSIIPGLKFQKLAAVKHDQLETRLNLIRYVSHEMRTPLNTVSMGTSILKDEIVSVSGLKRLSMDSRSQSFSSNRTPGIPVPKGRSFQVGGNDSKRSDKDTTNTANKVLFSANLVRNASSDSTRDRNNVPSDRIGGLLGDNNINRTQFVHAFKEMLETCQQVSESCTVAVSTLDDLLTFDKIDENKLVIEVEELNPWKLLLTTAKPFTINALQKNVQLRINLPEKNQNFLKTSCVRGDAFKLAQVIRNLLSNAIKFTPESGLVDVQLKVYDTVERGKCVRFSVKDSGAGISKQNMKKLFGQYVQFNAAQLQKGKGSGLGLWITKSKNIARIFLVIDVI
jgi:signal transduction histidine kinase